MGLIREPLDVDLVFDPRPLTENERKMIKDFIKADKLKRAKVLNRKRTSLKKRTKEKSV